MTTRNMWIIKKKKKKKKKSTKNAILNTKDKWLFKFF